MSHPDRLYWLYHVLINTLESEEMESETLTCNVNFHLGLFDFDLNNKHHVLAKLKSTVALF